MGKKGHVRVRPGKNTTAKLKGKRRRALRQRLEDEARMRAAGLGSATRRRGGPVVVAAPSVAAGKSDAAQSFALHSLLLGSNPNGARVSRYSSAQNILVVGEGDFSWALSLAVAMGGKKLTATCYDSKRELFAKYPTALDNVTTLRSLGATVLYDVDGTALHTDQQLRKAGGAKRRRFHRVVFNFPHVGGGSTQEDVEANQAMLRGFFASAQQVVRRAGGEIHVALRSNSFYDSWKIKEQAQATGLVVKRTKPFVAEEFHGYKPQRTHPAARESPDTAGAKVYMFGPAGAPSSTLATARAGSGSGARRRAPDAAAAAEIDLLRHAVVHGEMGAGARRVAAAAAAVARAEAKASADGSKRKQGGASPRDKRRRAVTGDAADSDSARRPAKRARASVTGADRARGRVPVGGSRTRGRRARDAPVETRAGPVDGKLGTAGASADDDSDMDAMLDAILAARRRRQ